MDLDVLGVQEVEDIDTLGSLDAQHLQQCRTTWGGASEGMHVPIMATDAP